MKPSCTKANSTRWSDWIPTHYTVKVVAHPCLSWALTSSCTTFEDQLRQLICERNCASNAFLAGPPGYWQDFEFFFQYSALGTRECSLLRVNGEHVRSIYPEYCTSLLITAVNSQYSRLPLTACPSVLWELNGKSHCSTNTCHEMLKWSPEADCLTWLPHYLLISLVNILKWT